MVFSAMGAAYGTAKSGTGIAAMSVMRPELIMKSIIPVVMAGIIAIYGVVVAVLIAGQMKSATDGYTLYKGFVHLGAGLAVGLSGLAAGYAIGIVGDAGVRGTAQQPRLFVGMILILISPRSWVFTALLWPFTYTRNKKHLRRLFPSSADLTRKKRKSVIQFFSSKNTDFKTLQKVRPFPVKK